MNLLPSNITFAVFVTDGSWRTDLTIRFCEYYSHRLNGDESFTDFIIFPESFDEALAQCKTDYLLIQAGGHIPVKMSFFEKLDKIAEEKRDLILGHILLENDYIALDTSCLFVNMMMWRELDEPAWVGRVREGPAFNVSIPTDDKVRPKQLIINTGEARQFIPSMAAEKGAALIVKQLDTFGQINSIPGKTDPDESYFIDIASPYREIHTETFFEKKFLKTIRSRVFSSDTDDMNDAVAFTAEVIVAPAQGLKAQSLAEYYGAKKVIVYDSNPDALELQKKIFGVQRAMTYGDIIRDFKTFMPEANIDDGWKNEQFDIVVPLKGVDVEFRVVDVFSFEIEDLIKSIDHAAIAVFDLSDIFVYPFNYYRKPLYQVQGLFAEVYSLLKSRTGATHIFGFAPGFQSLGTVEVNTSGTRWTLDPTIDPNAKEYDDDGKEIEKPEPEPIMYAPEMTAEKIVEKNYSPPIPKELLWRPGSSNTPAKIAEDMGYYKGIEGEGSEKTIVLTLRKEFAEFNGIFEYRINEESGVWSFLVGAEGHEKKVEFSNGMTMESFLKHLHQPIKINSKSASTYFK